MKIHTLHGFLGLPKDWECFHPLPIKSHHLASITPPAIKGHWDWAKHFNSIAKTDDSDSKILMGYSLGGRLAMHALLNSPSQWKGGIIISSHLGFKTEKEKIDRLAADSRWADRFEHEPWEKVVSDWHSQPVFANRPSPLKRSEADFSRIHLGRWLRLFSRGHQDDLSHFVKKLPIPILWIGGKLDPYCHSISETLHFAHPLSQVAIVENAGHRVPWEQPQSFLKLVQTFIQQVSSC